MTTTIEMAQLGIPAVQAPQAMDAVKGQLMRCSLKLPELRKILKQNNIKGYSQYSKKRLVELLRERKLIPEEPPVKTRKELDPNYEWLKSIGKNPRQVILKCVNTGKEITFPSVYQAAKFIDRSPRIITFWDGRVWNNMYEIKVEQQKCDVLRWECRNIVATDSFI